MGKVISANCLIPFFLAFTSLQAQQFLVVEKMGTKKRFEYHPGDLIIFKLSGEKYFRSDEIDSFRDTLIIFAEGFISISDLEKISLKNKKNAFKYLGSTLITVGVGYFALDQFNKIISGDGAYIDDGVVRTSVILTTGGLTLLGLANKKVTLGKNWRARPVDMRPLGR